MALAGTLKRAGWMQIDIADFVRRVELAAGGVNDLRARRDEVASLSKRIRNGGTSFGFSKHAELVGSEVALQIAEWLGIDGAKTGASTEARVTEVSEDAVASAFVEHHGKHWRYEHANQRWFRWSGNVWEEDKTRGVEDVVRRVVRELTEDEDVGLRRSSRKSTFVRGVLSLAASDRRIAVSHGV